MAARPSTPGLRPAAAVAVAAALFGPLPAAAQLVSVRTVPLVAGDQFLVHPSRALGMGGVKEALDDPLLDPFVNPAKGAGISGQRFLGSPTYYGVSGDGGAGRTLPVTLLTAGERWFGAVSVALQEVEASRSPFHFGPEDARRLDLSIPHPVGDLLSEGSAANAYLTGLVGRRLDGGVALAGSASWAGLNAVAGVEHLYAGSVGVEAGGDIADFRLGVVVDRGEGRSLEAMVVHHRLDLRHEVSRLRWLPRPEPHIPSPRVVTEETRDRTDTWGIHLAHAWPLTTDGWRAGGHVTGNRKDHASIPDYEIANVSRDPGETWAYSLGGGVAREEGPAAYGVDVVFEPIWSRTWAVASEPVPTPDGRTIPPGGHTVDNDFFFRNLTLRLGVQHELGPGTLQLGLEVSSVSYTLEQLDHVSRTPREEDESWMEWSPTWGVGFDLAELRLGYRGRLRTGTGRPGVAWTRVAAGRAVDLAAESGIDFLPAPAGPLTLQEARVWTHRVYVSVSP